MEFTKDSNRIKLSKREIEVCNLLLTGNCTNKIAELLNIKCNTVSTIKKSIFNKTKTIFLHNIKKDDANCLKTLLRIIKNINTLSDQPCIPFNIGTI